LALTAVAGTGVVSFVPAHTTSVVRVRRPAFRLGSGSSSTGAEAEAAVPKPKTVENDHNNAQNSQKGQVLGLLTFDLDDSLYPLQQVIQEANEAFVKAMNSYGFTGIKASDIDETAKRVREEMAKTDPEGAAVLTHTEVRMLAIRKEMEKIIFERKLKQTAEDWATEVPFLADIVVKSARV
jgi:hypothetical protein